MKKIFLLVSVFVLVSPLAFSDVTLLSEEGMNNVVSSGLEGSWALNHELADKFYTGDGMELLMWEFQKDISVLQRMNEKEAGKAISLRAYSVGNIALKVRLGDGTVKKEGALYAVIERSGNPMIALFNPNKKSGKGDWEFLTVMFAKARQKENDLLILGGDHNEDVAVFKRVQE